MSLTFYAEQSVFTDPGAMAGWLTGLPTDVAALRRIAHALVVHYRADDLAALGIPGDRLAEVDTRYGERMLQRLHELDDRPLRTERLPQQRLVGCCRDFTVLFLTLLRQQGIPARARVGFATYFVPGWKVDHEVAEVWDAAENTWRLVDAELADHHVDATDGETFAALDVPRHSFLVAGDAWLRCREGRDDPERFVVDPGLAIEETRGWPQLRHNLIHDLAALNKQEMLLWDDWGLMEVVDPSPAELALLDRVAEQTRAVPPEFDEVRRLYTSERGLEVPPVVTSYSPSTGQPKKVGIER